MDPNLVLTISMPPSLMYKTLLNHAKIFFLNALNCDVYFGFN